MSGNDRLPLAFARLPAWLFSILIMNLAHAQSPEDAIKGQRLFFTEAQREQATEQILPQSALNLKEAAAEVDAAIKPPASESAVSHKTQKPQSTLVATGDNYQVYFSGLVVGRRGRSVLVNGLPCQFEPVADHGSAKESLTLDCSGVENKALDLKLLPDSGVLMVSDAQGQVHRLVPGEQW